MSKYSKSECENVKMRGSQSSSSSNIGMSKQAKGACGDAYWSNVPYMCPPQIPTPN